ncbi:MAG TPA: hypothetical protein VK186_00270 [Candidatus Deferrimicrobium sp.]|nr:hypothetical protein [Candidatus Kapabacteria bacterium]HLP57224.1 hypothetical protein [Candidatus Deferrimicrobium sp.]
MKFYNREQEIRRLTEISRKAETKSQMTIILGRRRIGKTRLVFESFKKQTPHFVIYSNRSNKLWIFKKISKWPGKF